MTTGYNSNEYSLRQRYTIRYVVAMSLIAAAIILGALQLRPVLELNHKQAEILEMAGAQRMLSQRLSLLPDRILNETNGYRRQRALDSLKRSVAEMRHAYNFLVMPQGDDPAPSRATPALTRFYSADGLNSEATIDRFISAFERFAASFEGEGPRDLEAIGFHRVMAETQLLVRLDRAVELHTQAAEGKMAKALRVHGIWVLGSLGLILLVAFFIFRPMARDAAKSVANIGAALDERTVLLSRSLSIAKMGHWRTINENADPIWISQELLDLCGMDLSEGFHPLSVMQAGDVLEGDTPIEDNTQHLAFRRTWQTGEPTEARSQFRKPNGDVIDILVNMAAERDASGKVVGVVGVIKDDTAEAEADRALKKSYAVIEQRTKDLHEAQRLGKLAGFRFDMLTDTLECDERVFELLQQDPASFEMSVESVRSTYLGDGKARAAAAASDVARTGTTKTIIVQAKRGDGVVIDLQVRQALERDRCGRPVAIFGTLQDVTREQSIARELEKLAYYDNLTGLSNRTVFTRELERVCQASSEQGREAALLLLDLDDFKEVNDTLGHQAGDELLSIIGERLAEVVRDYGFVARLGGDEFALIIEKDVSRPALDALNAQIIAATNMPAELSTGTVQTNTSVGVTLIPEHGSEPHELLRFADLALYASKADGRGRASYYNEQLSVALKSRMALAHQVSSALEDERFEVHYQPLVQARDLTVGGFEALLRLPKGDGSYISPAQFIPVAESSDLIAELGAFVLHRACKEAKAWLDAGQPERTVAVNVSAAQIWHGDLEAVVDSALAASQLDPTLLCLELTESVFAAERIDELSAILARLKGRGITLALDDFGTGYSSLSYLNQLPFDRLKIDRMFVRDAHLSAEKQKMLRGVVSLSKGLDLKVTAEGVENEQEVQLVRGLGCDSLQGWFFSKAQLSEQALVEAARIDAKSKLSPFCGGAQEATAPRKKAS